jgi:N-acetylglucosaminyldiphosphoundecaprenol N-acetyl-beta-D-mannosaminyltransferase
VSDKAARYVDDASQAGGDADAPKARQGRRTVELLGIMIDSVTRDEAFAIIDERIAGRVPGFVVTPNVDHVCRCHEDDRFRAAYGNSFLVLPDGVPVMWASRLLGTPLREKISGSDLVVWLSAHAAACGHSLFLFGAAEGVAAQAAAVLQQRNPGLTIAGTYSPPLGFHTDPKANAEAVRRIRESQADVCMLALGSPKQEIWMNEHCEACSVPVMIGVGAGLDFVAGKSKRAPRWAQRTGLEWAWRLCHEPRRLWRRYLVDDMLFFRLLWRELWRRKRGQRA